MSSDPFDRFRRAARLQRQREALVAVPSLPTAEAVRRAIEALCRDYGGLRGVGPDAWQVICVRREDPDRREVWWLRSDELEWRQPEGPASDLLPDGAGAGAVLARGRDHQPPEGERLPLYYVERVLADHGPQPTGELLAWSVSVWTKEFVDAGIWRRGTFEPQGEWPPPEILSPPPFG
jgi:hypothetical protein